MEEENFTVACNRCGQKYDNWVGSTPCCGSIAYRVDTEEVLLFSNMGVVTLDFGEKESK